MGVHFLRSPHLWLQCAVVLYIISSNEWGKPVSMHPTTKYIKLYSSLVLRWPLFSNLNVHINVHTYFVKWKSEIQSTVVLSTFLSKWGLLVLFHWIVKGFISPGMVNFLILLNTDFKLPHPLPFCHHLLRNRDFELHAYGFMNKLLLLLMEMSTS